MEIETVASSEAERTTNKTSKNGEKGGLVEVKAPSRPGQQRAIIKIFRLTENGILGHPRCCGEVPKFIA
jgi:hypothetical protein